MYEAAERRQQDEQIEPRLGQRQEVEEPMSAGRVRAGRRTDRAARRARRLHARAPLLPVRRVRTIGQARRRRRRVQLPFPRDGIARDAARSVSTSDVASTERAGDDVKRVDDRLLPRQHGQRAQRDLHG